MKRYNYYRAGFMPRAYLGELYVQIGEDLTDAEKRYDALNKAIAEQEKVTADLKETLRTRGNNPGDGFQLLLSAALKDQKEREKAVKGIKQLGVSPSSSILSAWQSSLSDDQLSRANAAPDRRAAGVLNRVEGGIIARLNSADPDDKKQAQDDLAYSVEILRNEFLPAAVNDTQKTNIERMIARLSARDPKAARGQAALKEARLSELPRPAGFSAEAWADLVSQAAEAGPGGFYGGLEAKAWREALSPVERLALEAYETAIVDGIVEQGELPADVDPTTAARVWEQARLKGAYLNKRAEYYDPTYLQSVARQTSLRKQQEQGPYGEQYKGMSRDQVQRQQWLERGQYVPGSNLAPAHVTAEKLRATSPYLADLYPDILRRRTSPLKPMSKIENVVKAQFDMSPDIMPADMAKSLKGKVSEAELRDAMVYYATLRSDRLMRQSRAPGVVKATDVAKKLAKETIAATAKGVGAVVGAPIYGASVLGIKRAAGKAADQVEPVASAVARGGRDLASSYILGGVAQRYRDAGNTRAAELLESALRQNSNPELRSAVLQAFEQIYPDYRQILGEVRAQAAQRFEQGPPAPAPVVPPAEPAAPPPPAEPPVEEPAAPAPESKSEGGYSYTKNLDGSYAFVGPGGKTGTAAHGTPGWEAIDRFWRTGTVTPKPPPPPARENPDRPEAALTPGKLAARRAYEARQRLMTAKQRAMMDGKISPEEQAEINRLEAEFDTAQAASKALNG